MITRCSFCGFELNNPLHDGIAFCCHCSRIIEASTKNKLLSAGWELRKNNGVSYERFKFESKLEEHEAELIYGLVAEDGRTHDELLVILADLICNLANYNNEK